MAVLKRMTDHHRAAGKISVLYAHARGFYGEWARTHVNNLERRKFVVARDDEWQDSVECQSSRSDAESPEDLTIFRTFYQLLTNTCF